MALQSWFVRGLLTLVIGALAAGAGWWFFIREDNELASAPLDFVADATATPGVSPAVQAAASPVASNPGTTTSDGYTLYTVVPSHQSVAGVTEAAYFADEEIARLGVPSTAKGVTNDVSGQFAIGSDGLDASFENQLTVGLTTLTSDEGRRDSRVQEALETSTYPVATFTASSISGWPGDLPEGEDVEFQLTGLMDLHGVQQELTWDVVARRKGDVVTALATVNFLYADFNIPLLNIAGFVSVEEDVTLQVQLIAKAGS